MIRITLENTRLSYLIADFKLTKWNADYVQVLHTNTIAQGYRVIKNWYFRNMSFVMIQKQLNISLSRFIYHSQFQEPIGHDDFYLNGGETQPWCSPIYGAMCSTKISYDLLTAIFEVLPSHFDQIFLYLNWRLVKIYYYHVRQRNRFLSAHPSHRSLPPRETT